jgi:hypothetical protein
MKRDAEAIVPCQNHGPVQFPGQNHGLVEVNVQDQEEERTAEFLHPGLTLIAFAASVSHASQPAFLLLLGQSVAWAVVSFTRNYQQQQNRVLRAYWLDRTICNAWQAVAAISFCFLFMPLGRSYEGGLRWAGNTVWLSHLTAPSVMPFFALALYFVVRHGSKRLRSAQA